MQQQTLEYELKSGEFSLIERNIGVMLTQDIEKAKLGQNTQMSIREKK